MSKLEGTLRTPISHLLPSVDVSGEHISEEEDMDSQILEQNSQNLEQKSIADSVNFYQSDQEGDILDDE